MPVTIKHIKKVIFLIVLLATGFFVLQNKNLTLNTYAAVNAICQADCEELIDTGEEWVCTNACDDVYDFAYCVETIYDNASFSDEYSSMDTCIGLEESGNYDCSYECFDWTSSIYPCLQTCAEPDDTACEMEYENAFGGTYADDLGNGFISDFCSYLPAGSGGGGGFTVTLDDEPFYLSNGGVTTITGESQAETYMYDIYLYDILEDNYISCDFSEDSNYLYYFSCDTPNLTTEGTYPYKVFAEDDNGAMANTNTIMVEIDPDDTKDLTALWRFDDESVWLYEDISGLLSTNHSAVPDSSGYIKDALDSSAGYMTVNDSVEGLSFDQSNSHFVVEAMVKKDDFTGGYTRIAGKNNSANDENTWLIGTDYLGGLYCGIWIDGNQESFGTGTLGGSSTYLTADTWNKVACEWNAVTRELTGYIDGTQVHQITIGGTLFIDSSTNDFAIGARPHGGDNFGGLIDNVKIYSIEEISDSEAPIITVDDNFNFKTSTVTDTVTGSATDDSNISSVEISRLGSGSWNSCTLGSPDSTSTTYSCTTGPLLNLETNYFIIRATDEYANTTSSNYKGYQVEVDTLGGMNLVGLWTMEDNSPVTDLINANNGTVSAPTTNLTGQYNDAIDLTSSRYISIDDSDQEFDFTADGTLPHIKIEASINSSDLTGNHRRVVGKYNEADNENLWLLGIDNSGGVYCSVWLEGGTTSIETGNLGSPVTISADTWTDIACDWNANTGELTALIDGSIVSTVTSSVEKSERGFAESTNDLTIGARPDGSSALDGYIDNVKITSQIINVGDFNPPIITLNSLNNANRLTDTTPTFSGSVGDSDTVASMEYLINSTATIPAEENVDTDYTWTSIDATDGAWDEQIESFSFTISELSTDGTYYVFVRATDAYGNKSYYNTNGNLLFYDGLTNNNYMLANQKFYLEVTDSTAPQITLNALKPNPTTATSINLTGTVKDNEIDTASAISEIQYQLDGGTWTNATILSSNTLGTQKNYGITLKGLAVGTHTVSVKAKDASNNETGTAYETCYDLCITIGLQDEALCGYGCDSYSKTNNKSTSFEILASTNPPAAATQDTTDFSNYTNIDSTNSTAIIGNGKAVLPKTYSFTSNLELYTNSDEFGGLYGSQTTGVFNSIDNNLWLTFNNGTFAYYNKTTELLTRYPALATSSAKITELVEFTSSGNRYLALSFDGGRPLYIYSLGTTVTNITDDSSTNLGSLLGVNSCLTDINIDTRSGYASLYGLVCDSSTYGSPTAEIAHIDTNGTLTNTADDTATLITTADGVIENSYSLAFDQEENRLLVGGDAYYSQHTIFYDDNGTPSNKTDDDYEESAGSYFACTPRKILKDDNGWYWYLGICGVSVVKVNELADVSLNRGYVPLFALSDFNNQTTKDIALITDPLSGRQEVVITTEEGTMYIYDNNGTYENLSDDQLEQYSYPSELYASTQSYSVAISNNLDSWLMLPGQGLYKVSNSRSYASSADVIIWPNITAGFVETDHVTLQSVTGNNLGNITYFVSNDGGTNWTPITIGETVSFATSGNMLKLKAILRPESNDTPEVLGISISYAGYDESQLDNAALIVEYPDENNVLSAFTTEIQLEDELGFTPNWSGEVTVFAFETNTGSVSDDCFEYDSKTIELTTGQGEVETTPLCSGDFYFVAQTEDGRSATGGDISIKGTSDPIYTTHPELCGNGVLDDGEQCDYEMESETYTCNEYDDKYTSGNVTCSTQCEYVTDDCEEDEEKTVIQKLIDKTTDIVTDETGNNIDMVKVSDIVMKSIASILLLGSLITLPYYILRIILGLLTSLGIKGKGNKYAYVYNSITKEPIKGAIVRISDSNNKLVQTELTGTYGEIITTLDKGQYKLSVLKPGFIFPSQIIKYNINSLNQNISIENLSVTNQDDILVAIPMDPNESSFLSKATAIIQSTGNSLLFIINLFIFLSLLGYSIYAYLQTPTILNLVVLIVYGIYTLFVIFSKVTHIKYGVVQDQYGNVLENITVRLYENEFNQPVAERVTDTQGRYRFIIEPGEYTRKIESDRYQLNESQKTVKAKKDPSIINDSLIV